MFISPSHLQFFISDWKISSAEPYGEDAEIISNGRTVAIPCQYCMEGETELIIGGIDEVPKDGVLAFEGSIETPSRILVASDVTREHLMEYPVSKDVSWLSIWTDGKAYPERVVVGVS